MIGGEIRARVFRDTKEFYATFPPASVAHSLIRFVRTHAGMKILDLGCATGNYCVHLSLRGYTMTGADIHPGYVQAARTRGVDAHLVGEGPLPFADRSFDSVLLFEVLEHLENPDALLAEARRVTRRNVLVTVPHCGGMEELQRQGLLFEHVADLDHRNFFTAETLRALLLRHFPHVQVRPGDGINPVALFRNRAIRLAGRLLVRLGLLRPAYYFRLFAVAGFEHSP
ncbi:MAG: class I SAM-dependent methyltransferase [Bacteroidota bacterium]